MSELFGLGGLSRSSVSELVGWLSWLIELSGCASGSRRITKGVPAFDMINTLQPHLLSLIGRTLVTPKLELGVRVVFIHSKSMSIVTDAWQLERVLMFNFTHNCSFFGLNSSVLKLP